MTKAVNKKVVLNTVTYIFLFTALAAIIKLINVTGFIIGRNIYKAFEFMDYNNAYLINVIHHLFQGIVSLGIIIIISHIWKKPFSQFYLVKKLPMKSIKTVLVFIVVWTLFQFIFELIYIYLLKLPFSSPYPLTAEYILPDLLFQLFLTGPSEELLFRSLAFSVLYIYLSSVMTNKNTSAVVAVLSSVMIFMFDHINFSLNPLEVTHFNIFQMFTCGVFGIFYSMLLLKYKSIIPAMIAHSLLNVNITLLTVLQFALYR